MPDKGGVSDLPDEGGESDLPDEGGESDLPGGSDLYRGRVPRFRAFSLQAQVCLNKITQSTIIYAEVILYNVGVNIVLEITQSTIIIQKSFFV